MKKEVDILVTLWVINSIADIFNYFLIYLFGQLVPTLTNITSFISNYSVPQTIYDVFAMCAIFLPMGTISILAFFTITIVGIKFVVACIHVITLGVLFDS